MRPSQKHKYQAYAAATQTLAKTKQIILLYDGVIRFVQQAKTAIEEKRIEDRFNLLIKASEVIAGLQACLDFEKGGDIAKVLYNFYASVDSRIFSIHRSNSTETCDEIVAELKQMREAWQEIDARMTAEETVAAAAAVVTGDATAAPAAGEQSITFSA
jgi:flagellar protein FliS